MDRGSLAFVSARPANALVDIDCWKYNCYLFYCYIVSFYSRQPFSPLSSFARTNRALCLFGGRAAGRSSRRRLSIFRELEIIRVHAVVIRVVRSLVPGAHIYWVISFAAIWFGAPISFWRSKDRADKSETRGEDCPCSRVRSQILADDYNISYRYSYILSFDRINLDLALTSRMNSDLALISRINPELAFISRNFSYFR